MLDCHVDGVCGVRCAVCGVRCAVCGHSTQLAVLQLAAHNTAPLGGLDGPFEIGLGSERQLKSHHAIFNVAYSVGLVYIRTRMLSQDRLTEALQMLGEVLHSRGLSFDLVVVGGGALLLQDLIERPTADLDAIARIEDGRWLQAKPLPASLTQAVRDVAVALDLPREPRDEKDWLNGGPTILLTVGLPEGFAARATVKRFSNLTLRIAHRLDLIFLKLWAATAAGRGPRRDVDIGDLRDMTPTREEIQRALAWCGAKDGRTDFLKAEAAPVLRRFGFDMGDLNDV
ncbi:MAG: DUF6036 family nucleotidyltransferase [Myxococcota bacterium]